MLQEYYNIDLAFMEVTPLGQHKDYESADQALENIPNGSNIMRFEWIATATEIRELFNSCNAILEK